MSRFVLAMPEYNRIHQIIHGLIKEEGHVERGCTFFSIVGSYFLNKHYGIAATAVAGGFALCVENGPKCIYYGKEDDGKFSWGEDGFHMWVQTREHIIDFMAPIYAEAFAIADPDTVIPRKMLQKRMDDEKQDLNELTAVGDYMTFPDPELSEQLIDHFLSRPLNTDLLSIGEAWFGTRRGKQRPTIGMASNDGILRHLTLPSTIAKGAW